MLVLNQPVSSSHSPARGLPALGVLLVELMLNQPVAATFHSNP